MLNRGSVAQAQPDDEAARRIKTMRMLIDRLGGESAATVGGILCNVIAYNYATGIVTIEESGCQREAEPSDFDIL